MLYHTIPTTVIKGWCDVQTAVEKRLPSHSSLVWHGRHEIAPLAAVHITRVKDIHITFFTVSSQCKASISTYILLKTNKNFTRDVPGLLSTFCLM